MIEPIKVSLERKEYIRFSNYCYKNNYFTPNKKWNTQTTLVFFAFVVVFVIAINYLNVTLSQIAISFTISVMLFLFLAFKLFKSFSQAIPDSNSYLLSEKEYRLDDEGFHANSNYGYTLLKWSAFRSIKTDGDLLYLFVDRVHAIIIPARSFPSADASQQFVQYIKQHAVNLAE